MKSVLVATDYLKDIDGSFKILEMNTNIGFVFRNMDAYINYELLDEFVQQNNINTIEVICPKVLYLDVIDVESEDNSRMDTLANALVKRYSGDTFTVNVHYVETNAITVPYIEDNENTLIIRSAYDTTALIDDTYCRDNYEFLKLLYDQDSNLIPKTFINDSDFGFDTIGQDLRDNGDYPNYIIKERYPTTNYDEFPKILKIDNLQKLDEVKNNLSPNTILQEYIFNPNDVESGKLKTYRVVSLLYGSDLNVLDLFEPFIHTNPLPFAQTVDYAENGELQLWERGCYIQKYINKNKSRVQYHFDNESKILLPDGSYTNINQVSQGTQLKTLLFPDMPLTEIGEEPWIWKKPFSELEEGLVVTSTEIETITQREEILWLMNIELANGSKFIDVEYAKALAKSQDEEEYQFKVMRDLSIGDSILLFNNETNLIENSVIVDIKYTIEKLVIYKVDVEEIDAFLTFEENVETPKYAILQHNINGCTAVCCSSSNNAYQYPQCITNGGGYCGGSYSYEYCIEDGYGIPSGCNACLHACTICGSAQK
jgi:hypothetical protein